MAPHASNDGVIQGKMSTVVIAGPETHIPRGLNIRRAVLAPPGGIPAGGLPDNVHLWEGMLRADF